MIRISSHLASILAGAVLLCTTGCVTIALRERASAELGCPEDNVNIEAIGAGGYRVEACGKVAIYSCAQGPTASWVCQTNSVTAEQGDLARKRWNAEQAQVTPAPEKPCSAARVTEMRANGVSESAVHSACPSAADPPP